MSLKYEPASEPLHRTMINDTLLDVLYYRSPVYGRRLISAVARLLNHKVARYTSL